MFTVKKIKNTITDGNEVKEIMNMKMKKFIAAVAMVSMFAAALTGCGSDDSDAANKEGGSGAASSEWDSTNDITVVSREDGSGTRGAFIELFGVEEEVDGEKVDMTTEGAQITNSTSVMLTTVAGDEYAIGYVSLGSLDDTVKAVKIDGAEATAENIKSGTYKVSRPFNIATKADLDNEVAADFINFIMSEEGQKVIADNGYIPVDDVKAFEGTQPSGKAVVGGSSSVSPVMEKLAEAYKEVNPNAEIELQTSDSTTGMTSAIDGSYDIGMASRELKDEELAKGLTATVIATDGIAVIINKTNPAEDMTADQVKAIYTGEALSWDEVVE
jgi:phosphate transport system substrate-binding protein